MDVIQIGQQAAQFAIDHAEFFAGNATGAGGALAVVAAFQNPVKVAQWSWAVIKRIPFLLAAIRKNPAAFKAFVEAWEQEVYRAVDADAAAACADDPKGCPVPAAAPAGQQNHQPAQ